MFKNVFFTLIISVYSTINWSQETINQLDKDGKMHGYYIKYFPNGKLRYEGKFNHGREIGTFKFYAETGEKTPIVLKEFNNQNDSTKVIFFDKTGKMQSTGIMIAKSREGIWKYYFPDGKTLMSIEHYKNDVLEGEVKVYYKNGQLTEISRYSNGKLNGIRKRFADDGKIVEEITYKDSILNGPAIYYDANGVKIAEGNYVDGLKKGEWKFLINGEWQSNYEPEKAVIKK